MQRHLRRGGAPFPTVRASFFDEDYDGLMGALLDALGLVRVWVLERGEPEAEATPHLVPRAATIEQVAAAAHMGADSLRRARVWGDSTAQPGQTVALHHLVEAGDRVYLEA